MLGMRTEASTKHHGTYQGGETCGAEESQLTAGLGAIGAWRAPPLLVPVRLTASHAKALTFDTPNVN